MRLSFCFIIGISLLSPGVSWADSAKLNYFEDDSLPFSSEQKEEAKQQPPPVKTESTALSDSKNIVISVDGEKIEVLTIRHLLPEEQTQLDGKIKCADPLAAELKPSKKLRRLFSRELKLSEEKLPVTFFWIFGRSSYCFARADSVRAAKFNQLDDSLRNIIPWFGGAL